MIEFLEEYRKKKRRETQKKVLELRHWITKFFEDLTTTKETVELPSWVECKNLMDKLNINVEHPKIVNYYYNKLRKHQLL